MSEQLTPEQAPINHERRDEIIDALGGKAMIRVLGRAGELRVAHASDS